MEKKIIRSSENVVIAGNGPSLREIDYNRLPDSFDVFRCNQFYFEDSYFLGDKIKAYFFNPFVAVEQYYTIHKIKERGEYSIDHLILSSAELTELWVDNIIRLFPDVIQSTSILSKLTEFDQYIRFNELFFNKRVTSGVYMCAVAIANGYKNIYLAGLDFYQVTKPAYAFQHQKKNILQIVPGLKEEHSQVKVHSKDFDIEALNFLSQKYGVKIYSLSPTSESTKYFPLSEECNTLEFILKNKTETSIKDMLIPTDEVYHKLREIYPSQYSKAKDKLYANMVFKLFYDLVKLPSVIKKYLRAKKLRNI